jgi:hypothetical protein
MHFQWALSVADPFITGSCPDQAFAEATWLADFRSQVRGTGGLDSAGHFPAE